MEVAIAVATTTIFVKGHVEPLLVLSVIAVAVAAWEAVQALGQQQCGWQAGATANMQGLGKQAKIQTTEGMQQQSVSKCLRG